MGNARPNPNALAMSEICTFLTATNSFSAGKETKYGAVAKIKTHRFRASMCPKDEDRVISVSWRANPAKNVMMVI
jgi:hypothetical protein